MAVFSLTRLNAVFQLESIRLLGGGVYSIKHSKFTVLVPIHENILEGFCLENRVFAV